jgi:hypothetical protein
VALDGANEADRDLSLDAFVRQFRDVRVVVTSQTGKNEEEWQVWHLPRDVDELREGLLELWLGEENAATLSRRIVAEGLASSIVSGYDLRLVADLAGADPANVPLPPDRITLYRAMLARATGKDGRPVRLEGLKQLAWTMITRRRREILPEDEKLLGVGVLKAIAKEGVRIVRQAGTIYEFRHDQMQAFLASLWLAEEIPTIPALETAITEARAFELNRKDQEELWRFLAALLTSGEDLAALWRFASNEPETRSILLDALQKEADERDITLVRAARRRKAGAAML